MATPDKISAVPGPILDKYMRTPAATSKEKGVSVDRDVVNGRKGAAHAGGVNYDDPQFPSLQKAAYPDLAALKAALPVTKAFNEAPYVAKSMPGWAIIAADADTGHIEASQESRWFRFNDDIVIRVSIDVAGSRIDMRSTSRQGHSDYGVNAARIRAYFGALRKRIG
jgi:uncharacterized protein (DUF1499 family)